MHKPINHKTICSSFLIDQKSILALLMLPVICEGIIKKGAPGKGTYRDVVKSFIDTQRVSDEFL